MGAAALFVLLALAGRPEAVYNTYAHVVRCTGSGVPGALTPVVGAYCFYFVSSMNLIGAEIPRTSIPLRAWSDDGSSVTLEDNATGASATVSVEFESEVADSANSTSIWSYGQLLAMVNTALSSAHRAIGVGGEAIAIRYDPASRLFSFVVPYVYLGRVTLYTRWTVARLFGSFGKNMPRAVNYPSSSPREFMYSFGPNGVSDGQRSVYTQDASSLSAWSDLVDIEVVVCDQSATPATVVLTDYMPLPDAPDRAPYKYRGPIIGSPSTCTSGGTTMSIYYRFASGSAAGVRHPIVLHEGDYWRVIFGY